MAALAVDFTAPHAEGSMVVVAADSTAVAVDTPVVDTAADTGNRGRIGSF
jgi:hypothetical protein